MGRSNWKSELHERHEKLSAYCYGIINQYFPSISVYYMSAMIYQNFIYVLLVGNIISEKNLSHILKSFF